jgi:8-oxo-dGTP pyrophosphatase MutT (NUDIX family)
MSVPRPAATIMLLRRSTPGYEVLMLRRHKDLAFAGGAYVFPGGSVDPSDLEDRWESRIRGVTKAQLVERMGTEDALGFAVAAVREAFEESGILLAVADGTGCMHRGARLVGPEIAAARRALLGGERGFFDLAIELGLVLDLASVRYVAHWVTPVGVPRRFDTRFFVAPIAEDAVAAADASEVVDAVWILPDDALSKAAQGEFELVVPTAKNLERLVGFADLDELLETLGSIPVPRIEPRLYRDADGAVHVALPGDPAFATASARLEDGEALPAPERTRASGVDDG